MDPEALLEHTPFLRNLARSLLRDAARADDVVQEAWVAALRGPPARDELRPWLVGVVRNLARRIRRDEVRRARREELAARRDYERATVDIVAEEEARRELIGLVLDLREPYRTVLLLRFYDGLKPREISRRLNVEGSTVRSRLQRGLAELRARLDRRRDRRAWCVALIPLAQPAKGAAAGSLIATGAVLMKLKLIAAAAILAIVCALFVWQRSTPQETRRAEPPRAELPPPPADSPGEPSDQPPGPDSAPAPAVPLKGTITLEGADAGEVRLKVHAEGLQGAHREGVVDANVRAEKPVDLDVGALLSDGGAVALVVTARRTGYAVGRARCIVFRDARSGKPLPEPFEIVLKRAAGVRGTARDPGGMDLPEALVVAYPMLDDKPIPEPAAHGESDESGGFRLDVAEPGPYMIVVLAPGYRPAGTKTSLSVGEVAALEPIHLERGDEIRGRVTRRGGLAGSGAHVVAERAAWGLSLPVPGRRDRVIWTPERLVHGSVTAVTDSEGRYVIGGLDPVEHRVGVVRLPGVHRGVFNAAGQPTYTRAASAPAAGVDFEIATATLDIVVRHAGAGIEGAYIGVTDTRPDSTYGWNFVSPAGGTLTIDVRPDADYTIEVRHEGLASERRPLRTPRTGDRNSIVFDLEGEGARAELTLRLRPVGPAAPPLPPVYHFQVRPLDRGGTRQLSAVAGRDGRYRLNDLEPGECTIVARSVGQDVREGGFYRDVELRVTLAEGIELTRTLEVEPGGRLQITLRKPDGRTDAGATCTLESAAGARIPLGFAKYTEDGMTIMRGVVPGLPGPAYTDRVIAPGRYRLRLEPLDERFGADERDITIEPGRLTEIVITLRE